jgi:glycosyltransferase involved in cell wall biosynthesis
MPARGTAASQEREFLLDVSRLIWRAWRQGLPTGIDRVCLAYLEHFGSRSQAVIQRDGYQFVLAAHHSDRLFNLLREWRSGSRLDLIWLAAVALPSASRSAPRRGMTYINVGHTGLNEPSLPAWIAKHRLRAIYLVHDLIPISHPEYCRPGEADKHRTRMANVLASAAGVIGNSRATLDELSEFASAKGAVMPSAVVAPISGQSIPEAPQRRELPNPYFVTVGTIEGRKNHLMLLQVWQRLVSELGRDAPTLVIIGQRGWQAEPALTMLDRPSQFEGHMIELGKCDDDELAGWIAGARALLMPSFAEGFGLPIVEALQLSTPVIASDLPVYREIAGEIPTYVDPRNDAEWQRLIRNFMTDSPERKRQLEQAKTYRPPNWTTHFSIVEKWLGELKLEPQPTSARESHIAI